MGYTKYWNALNVPKNYKSGSWQSSVSKKADRQSKADDKLYK